MSDDIPSVSSMSIKDRIAALEKSKGHEIPISPAPTKSTKSNALAGRIAALQNEKNDDQSERGQNNDSKKKVGKLKLPPGGVQIIMPGPPPSLLRKQQEREERKQKMIDDAQKEDANRGENGVGKFKPPPGAIKVITPEMLSHDRGALESSIAKSK